MENIKKYCKCGSSGPFSKDKHTKDGLNYKCQACVSRACKKYQAENGSSKVRAQKKKYRDANREKIIAWNLFYNYGITQQQFDSMLELQNGCCKICNITLVLKGKSKRRACIDHCHMTNIIRGILCQQCNKAIGLFYDDSNKLRAAANYLDTSAQHLNPTYGALKFSL